MVYKLKLKLPITHVTNVGGVVKVETLTLTGDDFVNIVLGRQLGTKVHETKQILAIAGSTENNIAMNGPKSHLIVYDFDAHQPATTHVWDATSLAFQTAYLVTTEKGFGSGKADLFARTAADPAKGTIFAGTFAGAAVAGGGGNPQATPFNAKIKGGMTGLSGRLHVKFTDKGGEPRDVNGIVLNGTFTISGQHIDKFTE